MIDYRNRITPKFRNAKNFNNILEFLNTYDESSLSILQDMNNLDSSYSIVLDEIGKTLGVYPRPNVPNIIDGESTRFLLDFTLMDSDIPMTNEDNGAFRPTSNAEYSRILRAYAMGINFRGKMQEWEDILFALTGAGSVFENKASKFGIIIKKDLNIVEKKIVEYALQNNSLTVSIDFIGTASTSAFRMDLSEMDKDLMIKSW